METKEGGNNSFRGMFVGAQTASKVYGNDLKLRETGSAITPKEKAINSKMLMNTMRNKETESIDRPDADELFGINAESTEDQIKNILAQTGYGVVTVELSMHGGSNGKGNCREIRK